jgi:2-polyprenyl-3-methyl-5-hydroxy-6-metoxy-1,4-benzoquinol methylase
VRESTNEKLMSSDSQFAAQVASEGVAAASQAAPAFATAIACPSCGRAVGAQAAEVYGRCSLFACVECDLHFWEPRAMPDAQWYEQMYGGRDEQLLPLEPGHKYFLAELLAPGRGELLDIGCGTGNFLAAARKAGYEVSGTELDRNAARFAKERVGLPRVFPLTISEFVEQYPENKFDVVTFFEVLEHQAAPVEFIEKVKACLRPRGYVALSVPNRERWLTGPDVLDYPPNHFLRWSTRALKNLLGTHGLEVLAVREQPAGILHTAQMINMATRTGLSRSSASAAPASFRDVMQMEPEQAAAVLHRAPTIGQRVMQLLGGIKYAACFPAALAVYPYIRMRGTKGTYLYCLARRKD